MGACALRPSAPSPPEAGRRMPSAPPSGFRKCMGACAPGLTDASGEHGGAQPEFRAHGVGPASAAGGVRTPGSYPGGERGGGWELGRLGSPPRSGWGGWWVLEQGLGPDASGLWERREPDAWVPPAGHRGAGLGQPHADPGQGYPPGPGGQGSSGTCPHRFRQDGCLRHPPHPAPAATQAGTLGGWEGVGLLYALPSLAWGGANLP